MIRFILCLYKSLGYGVIDLTTSDIEDVHVERSLQSYSAASGLAGINEAKQRSGDDHGACAHGGVTDPFHQVGDCRGMLLVALSGYYAFNVKFWE